MKYRAKVDANQREIVDTFRKHGLSVEDLSRVGGGVPDLMVSRSGFTILVEVVGPDKLKKYKPRGLMPNQEEWHESWQGEVYVARDVTDAENIAKYLRSKIVDVPIVGQVIGDRVVK